jgi:hypothetical protein
MPRFAHAPEPSASASRPLSWQRPGLGPRNVDQVRAGELSQVPVGRSPYQVRQLTPLNSPAVQANIAGDQAVSELDRAAVGRIRALLRRCTFWYVSADCRSKYLSKERLPNLRNSLKFSIWRILSMAHEPLPEHPFLTDIDSFPTKC